MTATASETKTQSQTGSAKLPAWLTDAGVDELLGLIHRPANAGTLIQPVAPYTGENLPQIPTSTEEDVADAVATARKAQKAWAMVPAVHKSKVMLRFHDLLVDRQNEVIDLIQLEMGKARVNAWQEILQVGNIARHYARRGTSYLSSNKVRGVMPGLTKVREVRVPKGVVGIISPWNYPLYLGVGDVIPALVAGNTVVSKADSATALTLLWTKKLFVEAGLPTDAWIIVTGAGSVVGNALIDNVDFICFTGSTATGRKVAARAGERLIGASLELGGKNPMIVRPDADIQAAAVGAAAGAYANTGQMCIHIERVLVNAAVYDEFKAAFIKAVEDLGVKQSYDYDCEVGSLASEAQLETVERHVNDAVAKGAKVLAGGKRLPEVGPLAYAPTILEGVTEDMEVFLNETFGPVVSLYRVTSDQDALALANRGRYGLSASVWSQDQVMARALARKLRAGSVNINDSAAAAAGSIEAGMGGMGDSGLGRRHGAQGIQKYTESQTIATQSLKMPLGVPEGMEIGKFVKMGNMQLKLLRKLGLR
jgi:succinate-semialdehyde dehydrogenase/glutarate-semialdehyde dehydrogenase